MTELTLLPAPATPQHAAFASEMVRQLSRSLGVSYEELAADMRGAQTAAEVTAVQVYRRAWDDYEARLTPLRRRLQQRLHGPILSEIMLDAMGLPRGMRP